MSIRDCEANSKELITEILKVAGQPYTAYQLSEIPNIIAAKAKYWFCVDMQDWERLPECFVEPTN